MTEPVMKLDLPGLLREQMPSGASRWRVRVAGDKARRIPLSVTPDHPEFMEIYHAARRGIRLEPQASATDKAIRHSVAWLTHSYLDHLEAMVKAGKASPETLKQRRHFFARLRDHKASGGRAMGQPFADLHMMIPQGELIAFRDAYAATSGAADNMIAAIRSMYDWAISRELCSANPAKGIARIHINQGGATAWTVDDLMRFRERHPPGTSAHLALTLFMFTACRVSDAVRLGRDHETVENGIR